MIAPASVTGGELHLAAFEDLVQVLLFLVFIALPVVGRLLSWLLGKTGATQERAGRRPRRPPAPDRPAFGEEEERAGSEAWRRLLEDEESARPEPEPAPPPPPVAPVPRRAVPIAPPVDPTPMFVPVARQPRTGEGEPVRLFPSTAELPSAAMELVLEDEEDTAARADALAAGLGVLDQLDEADAAASVPHAAELLPDGASGWRRAVLLSEILGPPIALRSGADGAIPAER